MNPKLTFSLCVFVSLPQHLVNWFVNWFTVQMIHMNNPVQINQHRFHSLSCCKYLLLFLTSSTDVFCNFISTCQLMKTYQFNVVIKWIGRFQCYGCDISQYGLLFVYISLNPCWWKCKNLKYISLCTRFLLKKNWCIHAFWFDKNRTRISEDNKLCRSSVN